jgi:TP901-1 family phage major tail protein
MSGELKGFDYLCKIGDGGGPEVFTTLGGLQTKSMTLNNEAIEITNHGSNEWKEILPAAGVRSMSVSAEGVFNDHTTLNQARADMIAGTLRNFQLVDGSASTMTAAFKITELSQSGEHNAEHRWSLSLESSGVVTFA